MDLNVLCVKSFLLSKKKVNLGNWWEMKMSQRVKLASSAFRVEDKLD